MAVESPCAAAGNPCYDPQAIVLTITEAGLTITASSDFPGDVTWDFDDGSPLVTAQGEVEHTYATGGTYDVVGNPQSSAVRKGATEAVTVA